jgi:hypothetical protein
MEKINLPTVTLIAVTGKDFEEHREALKKSCEGIKFGAVKLVKSNFKSIDDWNRFIIFRLKDFVDTEHCILIHADGSIVFPELWDNNWLSYDYIGAPWPLPKDDFSYRTTRGEIVRVGNSVSLRSKKLLELPTKLNLEFKPYFGNTNEDGKLCVEWRDIFIENGINYAPLEVAVHFSKELEIPENIGLKTFAYHKYNWYT